MNLARQDIPARGDYALLNARIPIMLAEGLTLRAIDPAAQLALADLAIIEGQLAPLDPSSTLPRVDLAGALLLPTFTDMHVHLDKAYTVGRTGLPANGLGDAVRLSIADHPNRTAADLERRMEFALRCAYANGTAVMRSHLDTLDLPGATPAWAVFDRLRERWRGRIDLQGCGLMALARVMHDNFDARCAELAQRDAALGIFMDDQAEPAVLDLLLARAQTHGLDLDFHVDETLDANAGGLAAIADAKLRTGFAGRMTVGHCCALATKPDVDASALIDLVARAGIDVVSLPLTNLFLMDRAPSRTPRQRGMTLVNELSAAGVRVSFGSDNVCDPFFAYGNFDMLEVLSTAVRVGHLDADLASMIAAVTDRPATAIGRHGVNRLAVGSAADFVAFRATNWTQLLSRPHSDRVVVRQGRAIADQVPGFDELKVLEAQA